MKKNNDSVTLNYILILYLDFKKKKKKFNEINSI